MGISDKIKDAAGTVADKLGHHDEDPAGSDSADRAEAGAGDTTGAEAGTHAPPEATAAGEAGTEQPEVYDEGMSVPPPAMLKNMDASGKQIPS